MNYNELGFKCGIEIHQQLNTETKLFCNCPIDLQDENPDAKVERKLRSVEGETGEQDEAAKVESQKSRKMVYHYHDRNNCLVELDEEPPHKIDEEALNVAMTFGRMVDASIPDEIQVMRKIVVDGSNTSGFQRTSLVGLNGEIETKEGKVAIDDIELEEESAGINKRTEKKAEYDLSRLGVPLIEVGTDASIKNPKHAKQVAKKIGMLLRSTGKARRGIGTIRQDVNISIQEGARIEIKGFQDIENIDKIIENEVERQKNLVELGKNLENKEIEIIETTNLFEETENDIISTILENNGKVYALKLPGLEGLMKQNISAERYLAKELVDYAKTRGVKGMMHTDEDVNYGIKNEMQEIKQKLDKQNGDVIAVIAGEGNKPKYAAEAVKKRATKIMKGIVPEETRKANQDFTTSYARPLPGSARMYPETDIEPIRITEKKVNKIEENLPKTLEEKRKKLEGEIGGQLARQIVESRYEPLFSELNPLTDTKIVANLFVNILPNLESENYKVEDIKQNQLREILTEFDEGEISKEDIQRIIKDVLDNGAEVEGAIDNLKESKTGEEEIKKIVEDIVQKKKEMVEEQGMRAQGPLMGLVMKEVEADGQTVSQLLQEEIRNHI